MATYLGTHDFTGATVTGAGSTPRFNMPYPLEDITKYTTVLTGSGAVAAIADTGVIRCTTGTTDGSKAELNIITANQAVWFDQNPEVQFYGNMLGGGAGNCVSGVMVGSNTDPGATGALTAEHFGFIADSSTSTLDCSNSQGTTQTTTDISGSTSSTSNIKFRAIADSAVNIKFYTNQVLRATHTTNLPVGDADFGTNVYIKLDAGVVVSKYIQVSSMMLATDAE